LPDSDDAPTEKRVPVRPEEEACLHERLPANLRAPQSARRSLERALPHLPPILLDRLKLLVSELVTNAVVHVPPAKATAVELTVRAFPDSVSVEVADTGSGFEHWLRRPSVRDSGWGLFLVERLSDRWGVVQEEQTRVWFEIDRPVAAEA
jgi:anti-sigma regulatory factor (Ser/Thr protein kinase)